MRLARHHRTTVGAALVCAAAAFAASTQGPQPEAAPLDVATVATSAGPITVEIADDPATRARGLMDRQTMPRDHGMWFAYPSEAPRAFWMKNTPLPLDIVFIAGDGRVVSIAHERAETEGHRPLSKPPWRPRVRLLAEAEFRLPSENDLSSQL